MLENLSHMTVGPVRWPVLVGTRPRGRDTFRTGHSSPNHHSLCHRAAAGASWDCPVGSAGRQWLQSSIWPVLNISTLTLPDSQNLTDILFNPKACKPSPRCLVLCISCSGSTACDEHKSSTSCPERSWRGNRLHTPSPEEYKTSYISSIKIGKIASKKKSKWFKRNVCVHVLFLTPVWLGSPPQLWSTYQSPSHSQLREGNSKLWSGWGFIPVTSLHGQRSVGSSVSVKLSTGFHLWKIKNTHTQCNSTSALTTCSIHIVSVTHMQLGPTWFS